MKGSRHEGIAATYRDPFAPPADVDYENVWAAQRECRWGLSMARLLGGVHSGLVGQALDRAQIRASIERFAAAADGRSRAPSCRPPAARPRPAQAEVSPPRRTRPPMGEPRARPASMGPSGYPEPYRRVAPPPPPPREPAGFMRPTAAFHSYVGLVPSSRADGWDDAAQPPVRPSSRARSRSARPASAASAADLGGGGGAGASGRGRRSGGGASTSDLVGHTLVFRSVDTGGALFGMMGGSPRRQTLERDGSALRAARAAPALAAKGSWAADAGGRAPPRARAAAVPPLSPAHARPERPLDAAGPRFLTPDQQRELLRARAKLSERGRAVLDARLEAQGLTSVLDSALASAAHVASEQTPPASEAGLHQ